MTATGQTVDVCNELLHGEICAIDTYTRAMAKFDKIAEDPVLRRVRSEHQDSAEQLREFVAENGGCPSLDSGMWDTFLPVLTGDAAVPGESFALQALEEGEELGMRDYQDALASPNVPERVKSAIRQQLLPRLSDHVSALQRLRNR